MDAQQILMAAQDAMTVRRIFGDPIQAGDVTIVPVAKVSGGGGGGGKGSEDGGAGYGLRASPAGVYAIREGRVRWRPAIDVNRVILGGQLVGMVAILTLGPILRRWLSSHASAPAVP